MATDPPSTDSTPAQDDVAIVEKLVTAHDRIRSQLARVIVGQDAVIDQVLITLFAAGHCILEGVPGLAKTLLVSTLARQMSLSFSRIPGIGALLGRYVHTQELLVRAFLHCDEVRHRRNRRDAAEIPARALATRDAVRHVCS